MYDELLSKRLSLKAYKVKANKITGTNFIEVRKKAYRKYKEIVKNNRRKPYVRSTFFKKEKVFISLFWSHLFEKYSWRIRMDRLKFFSCAIELIEKTNQKPTIKTNPNNKKEILYRFKGITKEKDVFFIQIKENTLTDRKDLISIFPS